MSAAALAINGGPRAVPEGTVFHTWPAITPEHERLVLEALRQTQHAYGPHVRLLEQEFGAWNGHQHVVATNCGTAALHLAVAGCGVGAGDEVVTTALSWTSSATCILHHNAVPVFVDVDWTTMLMDPARIEAAITERTGAILVVHYWGLACEMDAILAIARRHGLPVIEDACQAVGCTEQGRRVGTMGDCAAFSMNQNKNLCGGEGGLFVTDDEALLKRARAVMSFGDMRPPEAGRDYHHYGLGYKYGHANLPSAFALAGLRQLDRTNAEAVANWHRLDDQVAGVPNLVRPFSSNERPTNGYAWVPRVEPAYAQRRGVGLRAMTDAIAAALKAEGVAMNAARWLLPAHGVFQAKNAFGKGSPWTGYARAEISYDLSQYPVAQQCVDTCLWNINLHRPPNGPEQVDAMAAAIRKVFEHLDDVPVPAPD